ncbi:hypothetical protein [Nocardia paucivorans]|uniref:hypothetical protein n=1 Tax=Nocardia paucivorans TaxID=114259 RepID=UPI000685CFF5|nr:hypothetical protein [Nocardia paucivorans]
MTERPERHVRRAWPATWSRIERPTRRALLGSAAGLIVTPVALGIAANGAVIANRWWDATDRWLAPAQSVLGAGLLLLVAVTAVSAPGAAMVAGLVWGIVPGLVQIACPEDTYRMIVAVPGLPTDLDRALHTWLSGGVALMIGVLLFGVGLTATARGRNPTR